MGKIVYFSVQFLSLLYFPSAAYNILHKCIFIFAKYHIFLYKLRNVALSLTIFLLKTSLIGICFYYSMKNLYEYLFNTHP